MKNVNSIVIVITVLRALFTLSGRGGRVVVKQGCYAYKRTEKRFTLFPITKRTRTAKNPTSDTRLPVVSIRFQ